MKVSRAAAGAMRGRLCVVGLLMTRAALASFGVIGVLTAAGTGSGDRGDDIAGGGIAGSLLPLLPPAEGMCTAFEVERVLGLFTGAEGLGSFGAFGSLKFGGGLGRCTSFKTDLSSPAT